MVVVKYLDGVGILAERLQQLCNTPDLTTSVDWEAREEGYYAAHLYVEREYSIPLDLGSERVPIKVEMQVTTQLQEAINRLTHKYYEVRRRKIKSSDSKWQWDYGNDEFIPNYLGHILHYVEGMIMEVRNREMKK
jgi:ppGpp synthetase/RelA/SpoT-type nucleotidyltranferase